jgi:hypothetical protein
VHSYNSWPYTVEKNFATVRWPVVPPNGTSHDSKDGPYMTNNTAFLNTLFLNKPYGVSFSQAVLDLMSVEVCF